MSLNTYFTEKLNYSLGNEDSLIEMNLMGKFPRQLCIAGSGARVIPLLANEPEHITVLDVSKTQLLFTQVRIAAIKTLDYNDYLGFWGYQYMTSEKRKRLFSLLPLSSAVKDFWLTRDYLWYPEGWYALGAWESALKKLGQGFSKLFRFDALPLFSALTIDQQIQINKKYWPKLRAKAYFNLVANKRVLNQLLYRGGLLTPGFEVESNCAEYILSSIERLFNTSIARENFFLQWIFLGKILYPENALPETTPSIFQKLKSNKTDLQFEMGNAIDFVASAEPFGAYSFSDIVSYMTPTAINDILKAIPKSPSSQLSIFRSFLKHPQPASKQEWSRLIDKEQSAWESDKTGVYRFHIYKRTPDLLAS